MKPATIKLIKDELKHRGSTELVELCLTLAKFKVDNKALLSYLLFEAHDEEGYIRDVKEEMTYEFGQITSSRYFLIKKSVRKILRNTKKYIRYSKKKTTEVELLMHFCMLLGGMSPSYKRNTVLINMFDAQVRMIRKAIDKLHEDLQYDYGTELEDLLGEYA